MLGVIPSHHGVDRECTEQELAQEVVEYALGQPNQGGKQEGVLEEVEGQEEGEQEAQEGALDEQEKHS